MNSELIKDKNGPFIKFSMDNTTRDITRESVTNQIGGFVNVASTASGLANVLKNLVVPTTLVYIQNKTTSKDINKIVDDVKVVSEELYDNILSTVEFTEDYIKDTVKKVKRDIRSVKTTQKNKRFKNKTRKNKRR